MKRFHVNVPVNDLEESVCFYSAPFSAEPAVGKDDYAKWMLDDPRINFAISQRGFASGVNHLGFQVDSAQELTAMRSQLLSADNNLIEQSDAACCHAGCDKHWVTDPVGIAWETFHTLDAIPMYGNDTDITPRDSACCVPKKITTTSERCEPKPTKSDRGFSVT